MRSLSSERLAFYHRGLQELPQLPELTARGANGEMLAVDEAGVWKRVLNYRIAKHYQPIRILETHAGLGVGTALYKAASPLSEVVSLQDCTKVPDLSFDLIDIDPFGNPWVALEYALQTAHKRTVLMITNGEALTVQRGLLKSQKYPSHYKGKQLPQWVTEHYIPLIEDMTKMKVRFFYCFPTSCRVILSKVKMPSFLFAGCQQWMWWTARYAEQEERLF